MSFLSAFSSWLKIMSAARSLTLRVGLSELSAPCGIIAMR